MRYEHIFFLDIITTSSMEQKKSEYLIIMKEVASIKEELNDSLILMRDQFRENEMTANDIKEEIYYIKDSIDDILLRLDLIERRLDSVENEI